MFLPLVQIHPPSRVASLGWKTDKFKAHYPKQYHNNPNGGLLRF